MFDTGEIWARLLKGLRENDENMLLGLVRDLDIELTSDKIILNIKGETKYQILKKNIKVLEKYAGGDYIHLNKINGTKKHIKTAEELKELFGEKVTIK